MTEKELEKKIQLLYAIQPRENWVIETRAQVLGRKREGFLQKNDFSAIIQNIAQYMRYIEKPVFMMPALAILVTFGVVWQVSGQSVPGDTLYRVRTATEQIPLAFSSEEEKPFREIERVQRRMEDLKKVVQGNQEKNIPSAVKEFENHTVVVSESIEKIVENQPERALQAGTEIVQLQKEKLEVENILGIQIDRTQELNNATKKLVEYEVVDLENRSLTKEQEDILENVYILMEEQRYTEALEKVWEVSNGVQEEKKK